jgi:hypothetical protein
VLIGQWPRGARALYRQVRETLTSLGDRAAADRLRRYLRSAADLAAWERQGIERFIGNLY